MNFILSVSCVQSSLFAYFLVHRWGCLIWSLKRVGIIITWINSVCFGMYCIVFLCVFCNFFFFLVPGNDFLRLDLEELFWQIHVRCLHCARHSGYMEPASRLRSRTEYTPQLGKALSNCSLFIPSFIEKYLTSTHVCQAWLWEFTYIKSLYLQNYHTG